MDESQHGPFQRPRINDLFQPLRSADHPLNLCYRNPRDTYYLDNVNEELAMPRPAIMRQAASLEIFSGTKKGRDGENPERRCVLFIIVDHALYIQGDIRDF